MAPEIPLYKDEKYVKLLGKILKRLKEGYEKGASYTRKSSKTKLKKIIELSSEDYNRAVNALLSQPNRAFLDVMEKFQDLEVTQLAEKIKTAETSLLRKFQPVLGMEAHHILPQNVMTWLSELSPKKALQALHLYRKGGGTTGVVPENIKVSSQIVHRAASSVRKLADMSGVKGVKNFVSAHVDPLSNTLADNTKFFMEGFDRRVKGGFKQAQRFTNKDSLKFIVETIQDQAGLPSKLFAKAIDQDIETKARDWIKHLTGRDDLFTLAESGTNPSLIKKYNKALSSLGINFNDVVKAVAKGGNLPEVDKEILNVFKRFNESAASKVDKTWSQDELLRQLKKGVNLIPKPIKKLAKRGSKYVIPAVGLAVAGGHRELRASEYEENPTIGNLVQKKIADFQVGVEGVDTVTFGASTPFTWIPNVIGDIADSAIETTQDPDYKPGSMRGSQWGGDVQGALNMIKKLEESKSKEEEKDKNEEYKNSLPDFQFIK